MDSKVENTFSECFKMWVARVLITAEDTELALDAARSTVGFATSIIMCTAEAAIETMVDASETPDKRPGVIIQIWTRRSSKMKDELLSRLSQCAMTTPTTRIFNALEEGEKSYSIGKLISYFGDGYQKQIKKFGKTMWEIPVMDGDFHIEEKFNIKKGIAGGLFLLIGKNQKNTLTATRTAIAAIKKSQAKAITSFPSGICRAGSKIGSEYTFLDESTNHKFCPTLKDKVNDSLLPADGNCAYEIVINALTEEELKIAMKAVIQAVKDDKNILRITSTNYEGKLGPIQIQLKDLV